MVSKVLGKKPTSKHHKRDERLSQRDKLKRAIDAAKSGIPLSPAQKDLLLAAAEMDKGAAEACFDHEELKGKLPKEIQEKLNRGKVEVRERPDVVQVEAPSPVKDAKSPAAADQQQKPVAPQNPGTSTVDQVNADLAKQAKVAQLRTATVSSDEYQAALIDARKKRALHRQKVAALSPEKKAEWQAMIEKNAEMRMARGETSIRSPRERLMYYTEDRMSPGDRRVQALMRLKEMQAAKLTREKAAELTAEPTAERKALEAAEWSGTIGLNYYAVLGVPENADPDTIHERGLARMRECRPENNPQDPDAKDRFRMVATAYAVLSAKHLRTSYDRAYAQYKASSAVIAEKKPDVVAANAVKKPDVAVENMEKINEARKKATPFDDDSLYGSIGVPELLFMAIAGPKALYQLRRDILEAFNGNKAQAVEKTIEPGQAMAASPPTADLPGTGQAPQDISEWRRIKNTVNAPAGWQALKNNVNRPRTTEEKEKLANNFKDEQRLIVIAVLMPQAVPAAAPSAPAPSAAASAPAA